jgi:hypothetical protein
MDASKEKGKGNVIALSRYRAQLGRARKQRRADALLSAPDPARAIRALPGDELYYVVHEIGLRDAGDILAYARAEQVQVALDFALWERDRISPGRLAEWIEALADAPPQKIREWIAGLDVELVALLIRRQARIYDLSQEEPPEEPEGILFPTPDRFFVLDVRDTGAASQLDGDGDDGPGDDTAEPSPSARALIRLLDGLYRADKDLARRLLVGARDELDSELEELAYRWRQGRMSDLGFAEYYEALEVYRELDPTSVHIGEASAGGRERTRTRPTAREDGDAGVRAPGALIERLSGSSPFARAVQGLTGADEVDDLHAALVALTNRVLAADRVSPGDDEAVARSLARMAATLDIAVEFLARGEGERAVEAVRTVPLVRLHRLGVSLVDKVRRLALTLKRHGPLVAAGRDLAEREDAAVLEAVTALRPLFPGVLDDPPAAADRPFASLADVARATAGIERAAAAQAMLHGLGVAAEQVAPGAAAIEAAALDEAAVDTGVLARTALVLRVLGGKPASFRPLDPREIQRFQRMAPETIAQAAKVALETVVPAPLAGSAAAAAVAARWAATLTPLEPVLVRKTGPRAPR